MTLAELKKREMVLFRRIFRVMPSSPLQRQLQAERDKVRREIARRQERKVRGTKRKAL